MCRGRQYKAIGSELVSQYSLSMVLRCMSDDKYPFSLRAAFTRLLLHAQVDRDPQMPTTFIRYARLYHEIPSVGFFRGIRGVICLVWTNFEKNVILSKFRKLVFILKKYYAQPCSQKPLHIGHFYSELPKSGPFDGFWAIWTSLQSISCYSECI